MISPFFRRILAKRNNWPCLSLRNTSTESCPVVENVQVNPPHIPVMVNEVVDHLKLNEGDVFLDMTFGAGGHSSALLQKTPNLKIIALDRDPVALEFANSLKNKYPDQITPLLGKFSDLQNLMNDIKIKQNSIDGVLFDLGCSSMQFDYPERGFSVAYDGPLDMRMNQQDTKQLTAADVVTYADEEDLYRIFKIYGDEKQARKVARAILQARFAFRPLKNTRDLCDLIEVVCGNEQRQDKLKRKAHVATKIFQAIRIFVNNEINELYQGMVLIHKYLKPGGRAVIITFHSIEDQIVKRHFTNTYVDNCKKPLPLHYFNTSKYVNEEEFKNHKQILWEPVSRKVIVPSEDEILANPRSRSAKLRAAVKVSE